MKLFLYALLLFVLFVLPQAVQAQQDTSTRLQDSFCKGTKQITTSYGYGQGDILRNRDIISLRAGYYVADRLLIGVTGSLMKEWLGDFQTTSYFSGGPFVRYQFLERRLSPFAEIAYQYGRPSLATNQGVWFTPGVSFRLFSRVRLEASYSFMFIPVKEQIGQPQLGLTVLLGNSQ